VKNHFRVVTMRVIEFQDVTPMFSLMQAMAVFMVVIVRMAMVIAERGFAVVLISGVAAACDAGGDYQEAYRSRFILHIRFPA